jgi:hypothetical protein
LDHGPLLTVTKVTHVSVVTTLTLSTKLLVTAPTGGFP